MSTDIKTLATTASLLCPPGNALSRKSEQEVSHKADEGQKTPTRATT